MRRRGRRGRRRFSSKRRRVFKRRGARAMRIGYRM